MVVDPASLPNQFSSIDKHLSHKISLNMVWMLKISAQDVSRINPWTGWTLAGFVYVGMLSPKLYTKYGRSLNG